VRKQAETEQRSTLCALLRRRSAGSATVFSNGPVVDGVAHLPTRDVLEKSSASFFFFIFSLAASRRIGKVNDSVVTVSVLPDRLMELLRMSVPARSCPITGKSASPKLPVMPMGLGALEGPETLVQIRPGPEDCEQR